MKQFTVIVKKWFDKVNGNTHHSVKCIRHRDGEIIAQPGQYGYGDQYKYSALDLMNREGWIKVDELYNFERNNNYPIIWVVSEARTKKEYRENGVVAKWEKE